MVLKGYSLFISEATGILDQSDLHRIENCLRDDVFHSTLDWLTDKQFNEGAKKALRIIRLGAEMGYWEPLQSDPKPNLVFKKLQISSDSEAGICSFFALVHAKDTVVESHPKGFMGVGYSYLHHTELKAISFTTSVTLDSVEELLVAQMPNTN